MASPNTCMIDAWLNAAAQGPYRIEQQWTPQHAHAMAERIHDAIAAPRKEVLASLAFLLGMAYSHATEGVPPGPDGFEVELAVALAQLSMARHLVDIAQAQTHTDALARALAQPKDRTLFQAMAKNGGLCEAQLRALNTTDVFTLRRTLETLCGTGVLQTQDTDGEVVYTFSEAARLEWVKQHPHSAQGLPTP